MVQNIVRRLPSPHAGRVAFTGYRPQKMPFGFDETDGRCLEFKRRLYSTIECLIHQGYGHFISGGALGMDMYAAEAVIALKYTYPQITLEMVSPFDDQAAKWEPQYRSRREMLFDSADVITATGHAYTRSAMFIRNRYLVNNADILLAAYDGQSGGTQMTVQYARRMGIQVCCIRPVL
ncbi:MAG: DUF1273 family protein [Clostridia bacterium]|nr:DUF1273 family protein [Clostridia bacterium]